MFGSDKLIAHHVGINFAEAAVWYTIATLLATVKFTKARDFGGHEILPKIDHVGDGLVR